MTDLETNRKCAEALEIPLSEEMYRGELQTVNEDGVYTGAWSPLTDPTQNRECEWWLIERGCAIYVEHQTIRIVYTIGACGGRGYLTKPCRTREEFMRVVCLAVAAVKGAGNG